MENHKSKERDLCMVFVDFGKVYSHVLRDVLWKTLEKKMCAWLCKDKCHNKGG